MFNGIRLAWLMKIAVSACLLGVACRFDGASKPSASVCALREFHELVPICPEVAGGLSIPHAANEIQKDRPELCVMDTQGVDNTQAFIRGAQKTLERARSKGCEAAILKSKSPSCGTGLVYDGTFTGTLVEGFGVAADMLCSEGILVCDEHQAGDFLAADEKEDTRSYLYVLECADGTWYTGYTTHVEERLRTHNQGKGAKYTRCRLPVKLLAQAEFSSKREALRAEYFFKKLTRPQKEEALRRAQSEGFEQVLQEITLPSLHELR